MNPKKFRGWCANGCRDLIKKSGTKFCSLKCQHEFYHKIRRQRLEAGTYFAVQTTAFLRTYLVTQLGERCSKCGWSNAIPLRTESQSR